MKTTRTNLESGFTIIEMLVSLALFTIVATVATGALLSLIGNNSRVVEEQSVMTTLSFALDSMTREIRTGSGYYCDSVSSVKGTVSVTEEEDCTTAEDGLSIVEGGGSITGGTNINPKRIAYYMEGNEIKRKVDSTVTNLTSTDDVRIENISFFVTGSTPMTESSTIAPASNTSQPTVTIVIEATAANGESDKVYKVQTTVTQRSLDI